MQNISGTGLSESTGDRPASEAPRLVTEAQGNGQKAGLENTLKPSAELQRGGGDDDEDSDDSDVSAMFEDEELDEEEDDDEEEEDLSNGKTDCKADVPVRCDILILI